MALATLSRMAATDRAQLPRTRRSVNLACMKLAIVSDIHGNLIAFDAVIAATKPYHVPGELGARPCDCIPSDTRGGWP
jgi:hypothetical protein